MSTFFEKIVKSGLGVFTSRVLGLVRDMVIATFFGASKYTDAFFMAYAIPNLFRALFAEGALSSAFVPILSEKMHNDITDANTYLTDLMLVLSFFTFSIVFIFILFSDIGILIFIPGYADDAEVLNAASGMLRIVMPYLFLVSLCGLLSGYLNVLGSYYIPLSSTAVLNISMIVAVIIGGYTGGNVYCLAWGVFAGGFLQLFYIVIFAHIKGFRFRRKKKIDEMVIKTFKLIIPSIGGVGINQLNFTIGRIIASFLAQGSISYLYYASRLFQFPLGVFSIALSTVSLSEISNSYSRNDKENVGLLIDKSVLAILAIIIPATIGLFILSPDIIKLVFEYNSFSAIDTQATASALKMYAIGLICYSFVNLFTKVYHSSKDTLTPVKYAFISFLLNIGLNLVFINFMDHAGIALASSISAGVNAMLLYRGINYYSFDLRKNAFFIFKIFAAACGMMFVLLLLKNVDIHVLVNICVCAITYFALLYLFKIRLSEVLK